MREVTDSDTLKQIAGFEEIVLNDFAIFIAANPRLDIEKNPMKNPMGFPDENLAIRLGISVPHLPDPPSGRLRDPGKWPVARAEVVARSVPANVQGLTHRQKTIELSRSKLMRQ